MMSWQFLKKLICQVMCQLVTTEEEPIEIYEWWAVEYDGGLFVFPGDDN